MRFLSQGINAFVLQYSIVPNRFPTALTQLAESIRFIRSHADEWSIDTNQIFLNGFSAGGHLKAAPSGNYVEPGLATENNGFFSIRISAKWNDLMLPCYYNWTLYPSGILRTSYGKPAR